MLKKMPRIESAYMYEYRLYKNTNVIKKFNLVYIDGYRALLLMPKLGTNIVKTGDSRNMCEECYSDKNRITLLLNPLDCL